MLMGTCCLETYDRFLNLSSVSVGEGNLGDMWGEEMGGLSAE